MARAATVTSSKKSRLVRDYKKCVAEYRRVVKYLTAAVEALSKAECELLLEFAEIAKARCERSRRALDRLPHRSAA
jgi:hypothetical protein